MDHNEVKKRLSQAQETEKDNRDKMRTADHFLNKKDGQWESEIISRFSGKPRYTFDEVNPIVDDIMGEMEQVDFDIRVVPSGNAASKETANLYEGMIRTIENTSGASFVYKRSARNMVSYGMDAWRITNDYIDDDSFNQTLLIKSIPNVIDSVYFDPSAQCQTMEDADYCFVLSSMTMRKYEEKYPDGKGVSVGTERLNEVYYYKKPDEVIIGEYFWRKRKQRELALMNNGSVYEVNDDFQMVVDELAQVGITVSKTRKRFYYVVYHQLFDGADWLADEQESPFCYLPIIPVYGNFKISENKVIYFGVAEKLMDAQRVINYAESRKIEEGALAPRGKIWGTKDHFKSADVRRTLRTLNTNTDPVQMYDYVEGQPPPQYQGSPQSNPGLMEVSQSAQNFVQRVSGTYDESRGTAPAQRSGTAIDLLQQKSDSPKRKWFTSMEIALSHTCRILIGAIPKVYDTEQQVQTMEQDGTTSAAMVNQRVQDLQTGEVVLLNDLSKGKYDVTCTAGPAFHSRQQETVQAINEIAQIDPSIMQLGADVLLNNIASPGIDLIAERKRLQMLQQGLIPQSQLTDEEKQMMAQMAQQPKQPDAMMVAAQAEMQKAQATQAETQMKAQIEGQKLQLKQLEMQLKNQIEQQKLEQQRQKNLAEITSKMSEQVKQQAEALKTIREAMGADAVIDPAAAMAYKVQASKLEESTVNQ